MSGGVGVVAVIGFGALRSRFAESDGLDGVVVERSQLEDHRARGDGEGPRSERDEAGGA